MKRKKTLGYGIQTAAAHQLPDVSPPRSSPSSSPPSGIRLARPDVPRPGRSSVPPSLRSSVIPGAPANGNHLAPPTRAAASTTRAIAAIAAIIPPPPPSGSRPRSSAPPRPSSLARVAVEESAELMLTDDEVTYVPDEEPARPPSRRPPPVAVPSMRSTGQNWPLVAPLTLAPPPRVPTFGPSPLPSMTPTLLALEADAVAAAAVAVPPVTEQPAPSSPPVAPIPWVSLTSAPSAPADLQDLGGTVEGPVERAIDHRVDEALVAPPTTTDLDLEEIEMPLSPAAVLRGRIVAAWREASPNVRSALTFGAGIVVGALAVAIA